MGKITVETCEIEGLKIITPTVFEDSRGYFYEVYNYNDYKAAGIDQVFVQDHITTLSCTIYSLAGAYNAVPNLGIPQLVIGVQTQVNWEMSSPTTVIFE